MVVEPTNLNKYSAQSSTLIISFSEKILGFQKINGFLFEHNTTYNSDV